MDEIDEIIDPLNTQVYVDKPYFGENLGNVRGACEYLFTFGGNDKHKTYLHIT